MVDQTDLQGFWARRFAIVEKAGHPTLVGFTNRKLLTFNEGVRLWNLGAFLFGPFYYFFKGMWQKGFVLLGVAFLVGFVLTVIEAVFNVTLPISASWLPMAAVCAHFATYDYYMMRVKGETIWQPFRWFKSIPRAAGFAGACLVITGALMGFSGFESPNELAADFDGVWVADDKSTFTFSLSHNTKIIRINSTTIQVNVTKTDLNNEVIVLTPSASPNEEVVLRKDWTSDHGKFNVLLTITSLGIVNEPLGFVRPL